MKIYIIGSTGMLGNYVSKFLRQYYEVVNLSRTNLDVSNISEDTLEYLLKSFGVNKSDVVINCAGTIKPRVDQLGDTNAILVNSVFPRNLSNVCNKLGLRMIHPTTDCIFSGLKGNYDENDFPDVHDVYGLTKFLGEPKNCTVIRTSIIGEEINQGRSLVEWVKSEENNTVFGFTNHLWNGVTCLQFAKVCKNIIDKDLFWVGIKHIYSNTLNKKELVETISDVYQLNITVTPKQTEVMCDRSLSTVYTDNLTEFNIPNLKTQIKEMKEFSETLYKEI